MINANRVRNLHRRVEPDMRDIVYFAKQADDTYLEITGIRAAKVDDTVGETDGHVKVPLLTSKWRLWVSLMMGIVPKKDDKFREVDDSSEHIIDTLTTGLFDTYWTVECIQNNPA